MNHADHSAYARFIVLTILVGAYFALAGCRKLGSDKNANAVNIVCAPEKIGPGECAVLTILQMSGHERSNRLVLKKDALEGKALFARVSQTSGTTPDRSSAYRLQVYVIRPANDAGTVVIGREDFENLPGNAIVPPMRVETIR